MGESKYDFFEVVEMIKSRKVKMEGYILGKAQDEDGNWSYGVFVYDTQTVWSAAEGEVRSLGRFDEVAREEYKHRPLVNVRVDAKTGEGYLVDQERRNAK